MPTPEVIDPPTRAERADAAIDAHLIAPLDFDATPRCEWHTTRVQGLPESPPCGAPATWILILSCGHTFYYCEEHEALLAATLIKAKSPWYCAAPMPPRHPAMMSVGYTWKRFGA